MAVGATLFSKVDSNKLRFNVKKQMVLICAKFDADLINIYKVTNLQAVKQSGPAFLAYTVECDNLPFLPCGLRSCKNRPTPFPGRMSYVQGD